MTGERTAHQSEQKVTSSLSCPFNCLRFQHGGFLKWGYPQLSSILDWDFPKKKTSSYFAHHHLPIGSMYTIYGNMDPINIPPMLVYIPAPWILWVMETLNIFQ